MIDLNVAGILRQAPVPIFCCDSSARVSKANPAAIALMDGQPSVCWAATATGFNSPTFAEVWRLLGLRPGTPSIVRGSLSNRDRTSFICYLARPASSRLAICVLFVTPLFEAVAAISEAIAYEESLEPILSLIAAQARKLCNGHRAYLKLYNEDSGQLVFRALSSEIRNETFPEPASTAMRGLTGESFKTRQLLNCPNVLLDTRYHRLFADTKSELVAPLVLKARGSSAKRLGQCLGVIAVHSREFDAFTMESEQRLSLLASHATLAVREFQMRGGIQKTYGELLTTVRATQDSLHAAGLLHDAANFLREVDHGLENLSTELSHRSFGGKLHSQLEQERRSLNAKLILMRSLLLELKRGGGDIPEDERADILAVANEIRRALLPREHDLEIVVESEQEQHWAAIRPSQVRIVLFNLVSNSVRAIRHAKKAGSVRIVILPSPARAGFVRLQVIDDGPGLRKSVREALQTASSTTATPGGLGLGLITVREKVSSAKGSIEIAGRLGEGTTITVDLPTAEGE